MITGRLQLTRGAFVLDVTLDVPSAGVTGVFGVSGAGKTTLLRAIAGLERGVSGRLEIDGQVWLDEQHSLPTHRRPIGYVFQEASLFEHLSVRGNLEYGAKRVPASERRVLLADVAALLGIGALLERRPDSLSGGERQRVAIARALLASPRLLLMDEPLAALDLGARDEILRCLEELRAELDIPVLYVSHTPDEVARLADQLLLMEAGRVRASGPIGEMLTRVDLPLAQSARAEAIVDATVVAHEPEYGLNHLAFAGGRLALVGGALAIGARVRLRIAARDVSITLSQQTGSSILNILPATVDAFALDTRQAPQLTVRLLTGGVPLLARVTRKSIDTLQLTPGKQVFVQVKSVALL